MTSYERFLQPARTAKFYGGAMIWHQDVRRAEGLGCRNHRYPRSLLTYCPCWRRSCADAGHRRASVLAGFALPLADGFEGGTCREIPPAFKASGNFRHQIT